MPVDPLWATSTPETNYLRLVGPGAAGVSSTLASGTAWQALMASHELSFSLSALNTAVTALNFEGVGGLSSEATVTTLNGALQALAMWVQEKPPIAAQGVAAYQTAVQTMIPAEVSIANRTEQATDVAINPSVWGALTPAIVALDTEYFGEHWPHNSSTGAAYGAALSALIALLAVPPPVAPMGASPAAPAAAASAVASTAATTGMQASAEMAGTATQATGQAAAAPAQAAGGAGDMGQMMMQPMQAAMGMMQPLMGMFQAPMQAVQGMASLPQSMMGAMGGMMGNSMAPGAAGAGAAAGQPVALAAGAAGGGAGGGGGIGGGAGAAGGYPGAGMTNYTRPNSSFEPENAGRPSGLKGGLLTEAAAGGPAKPVGGGAMPMSPAHAGMLGHGKGDGDKEDVARSRVVVGEDPQRLS